MKFEWLSDFIEMLENIGEVYRIVVLCIVFNILNEQRISTHQKYGQLGSDKVIEIDFYCVGVPIQTIFTNVSEIRKCKSPIITVVQKKIISSFLFVSLWKGLSHICIFRYLYFTKFGMIDHLCDVVNEMIQLSH